MWKSVVENVGEMRLSVRQQALITYGLVGIFLLTSCGAAGARSELQAPDNLPYKLSDCTEEWRVPEDARTPLFSAASIKIESNNSMGHGFLLQHPDGKLSVTTVHHVLEDAYDGCSYFLIPGLGSYPVDVRYVSYWGKDASHSDGRDDIVSVGLYGDLEMEVQRAIKNGDLVPLQVAPNKIRSGDVVAIPALEFGEKIVYAEVEEIGSQTGKDEVWYDPSLNYSCQGFSGSPVLFVGDKGITNLVVAANYAGRHDQDDGTGRKCDNEFAYGIQMK